MSHRDSKGRPALRRAEQGLRIRIAHLKVCLTVAERALDRQRRHERRQRRAGKVEAADRIAATLPQYRIAVEAAEARIALALVQEAEGGRS